MRYVHTHVHTCRHVCTCVCTCTREKAACQWYCCHLYTPYFGLSAKIWMYRWHQNHWHALALPKAKQNPLHMCVHLWLHVSATRCAHMWRCSLYLLGIMDNEDGHVGVRMGVNIDMLARQIDMLAHTHTHTHMGFALGLSHITRPGATRGDYFCQPSINSKWGRWIPLTHLYLRHITSKINQKTVLIHYYFLHSNPNTTNIILEPLSPSIPRLAV